MGTDRIACLLILVWVFAVSGDSSSGGPKHIAADKEKASVIVHKVVHSTTGLAVLTVAQNGMKWMYTIQHYSILHEV